MSTQYNKLKINIKKKSLSNAELRKQDIRGRKC